MNLYTLPEEDPDRRIAWLQSKIAPYGGSIERVLAKNGPAPLTSVHTPLFDLIAREAKKEYGNIPVGPEILAAWSNDSRFLRGRGMLCYGLWPFPVDYYQALGIHGLNERIRLDWYMQGVALMRRLIPAYAFRPSA